MLNLEMIEIFGWKSFFRNSRWKMWDLSAIFSANISTLIMEMAIPYGGPLHMLQCWQYLEFNICSDKFGIFFIPLLSLLLLLHGRKQDNIEREKKGYNNQHQMLRCSLRSVHFDY